MISRQSNSGFTLTELLVTLVTSLLLVGLVYLFYLFIFKFNVNFTDSIFEKKEKLIEIIRIEKILKHSSTMRVDKSGDFKFFSPIDTLIKRDTTLQFGDELLEGLYLKSLIVEFDNGEKLEIGKGQIIKIPLSYFDYEDLIPLEKINRAEFRFYDNSKVYPLYFDNRAESIRGFLNK